MYNFVALGQRKVTLNETSDIVIVNLLIAKSPHSETEYWQRCRTYRAYIAQQFTRLARLASGDYKHSMFAKSSLIIWV